MITRRVTKVGKLIGTVVVPLLAPVIVVLLIVLLPMMLVVGCWVAAIFLIRRKITVARFLRREAGSVFLVCTARRNWYDFTRNNLIPSLPEGLRVVWDSSPHEKTYLNIAESLSVFGVGACAKPYLAVVTARGIRVRSLNADLQPLKVHAKISPEIRAACRQVIETAQKELAAKR